MKRLLTVLMLAFPLFVFAANDNKEKAATKETTSENTTLYGTIGDVSNYAPLSDVTLTLTSRDSDLKKVVKTDNEGKFLIENIPAGIYKVRFEKKGYEPGTYQSLVVREGSNSFGFLLFED